MRPRVNEAVDVILIRQNIDAKKEEIAALNKLLSKP
jgi:hypothetical protein